ncbi:hypothetical protein BY458DRAFT_483171 [Sporodiniella umbellata]|nr:hypothetical protein BY458DRAFT_483171 [Sporodiniella umbellata]
MKDSLVDEARWKAAAEKIDWFQPPTAILGHREGPNPFRWFPDGKLNTCYNCLDRHLPTLANQNCLIYDSPVTNTKQTFTFQQVLDKVQTLAGVLKSHGVQKGDVVLIYMPMIPEAFFTFLACARLGAIHCAVFGGFAPKELAKRISLAEPKVIMTASCGIEPKRVIPYKPLLEAALLMSEHSVPVRIVVQRKNQVQADMREGDYDYEQEMRKASEQNAQVKDCTPVDSDDPLYILYTSGTTGQPKGVVRTNGGHAVAIAWSTEYVFNIRQGDTIFTASDIGWAVSHCYTIYGPLMVGATTILFEGKPIGTPDAGTFWRLISDYGAKTMFTAPTAIRAIAREDPEGRFAKKYDLTRLTSLFLAGERSDSDTLKWCQNLVGDGCTVIDNYWSTELGSPVTGTCAGVEKHPRKAVKWGSAGKVVPGSKICILNEETSELMSEPNKFGNVVLKLPLPPAAFYTLWKSDEGYKTSYFDKFPGYFDTGDAGMIDEEGFVHIMSRTDDIINVAGHRLSTGSIEQVMSGHPNVAECCVVPMPDKMKGHVPFGVIVKNHSSSNESAILQELVKATRLDLGPIACFEKAIFVPRLPKTRSGKVLRKSIRELLEGKPISIPATIEDEGSLYEIQRILVKNNFIRDGSRL